MGVKRFYQHIGFKDAISRKLLFHLKRAGEYLLYDFHTFLGLLMVVLLKLLYHIQPHIYLTNFGVRGSILILST